MEVEVVVVGGGIAGLVTANQILEQRPGTKVLVLEAAERLGGRTLSVTLPSFDNLTIDLGGQWINSQTQPHITYLVKKLDIEITPQFHQGKKILVNEEGKTSTYSGSIPSLPVHSLLDFQFNVLNWIDSKMKSVPLEDPYSAPKAQEWDNITTESWKWSHLRTKGAKMFVDLMLRAVFGAEAQDLSFLYTILYIHSGKGALSLAEVKGGAQQDKLVGGSNQITEKLAERVEKNGGKVLLNHAVLKVEQLEDKAVILTTQNGNRFHCKYAVMAIPPTQISPILFEPRFPYSREKLMQRLFMGSYTKSIVIYATAFWRQKGFSGEVVCADKNVDNSPLILVYDATTREIPALVVFSTGKASTIWSDRPREQYKAAVLNQLTRYFGEEASTPLEYQEKDWNKDPWTKGCPVNHFPPGTVESHVTLREPFGNLHFAGTETALHWMGYMSGAVESGERAASEVVWRLDGVSDWKERIKIRPPAETKSSGGKLATKIASWALKLGFVVLVLAMVTSLALGFEV